MSLRVFPFVICLRVQNKHRRIKLEKSYELKIKINDILILRLRAIYLSFFQVVQIYTMFDVTCPNRDIFSEYLPIPSMVSIDGAFPPFYTNQVLICISVDF